MARLSGYLFSQPLLTALARFEDSQIALRGKLGSKRYKCHFIDILHPNEPYPPEMRASQSARLSKAFIRPLSTLLTGYRALDAFAHWVMRNDEEDTPPQIERDEPWPGYSDVSSSYYHGIVS
jgi:hypothetical protein